MLLRRVAPCLLIGSLLAASAVAFPRQPRGTPGHAAAIGGSALAATDAEPLADPFPIQRIFLPVERLDSVKADLARGTLKKLQKDEFETKVQYAAQMQNAAQHPARILEATYSATVVTGRITGTADWMLGHPTNRGSALPADPLPGAIQSPKWADGKLPLLYRAIPEGKMLPATFLWVEGPSQNAFSFQWSARLVEQPDEERCTLTFPASPISALELTLASDRVPALAQPGVLMTGPFPAAKSEERLWKFAFGGRTQLELAFRKAQNADDSQSIVRVGRAVNWKVQRGETVGQFEFAVQTLRQGSRLRVFQVDAGLEIVNVAGTSVESWQSNAQQLSIRFRDEAPTTRLTITARSATATNWVLPQIRLQNGLITGDTIDVQLAADCKLDGWLPGDYRLGATSTTDRSVKLEFVRTLLSDERAERRPPTIRIRPVDHEYSTVETIDWRMEPSRTKLTATFAATVLRGPIPNFVFQASNGYVLENVSLTPDDPGAAFGTQQGLANGWFVEPSRAAATGQHLEIRLEFRAVESQASPNLTHSDRGKPVLFPKVVPVGAGDRRGTFAVHASAGIKVSTAGLSLNATPLAGEPGFSVAYRGREPEGEILITRANPLISATVETEITGTATGLQLATALRGHVAGTPLQTILVWVPGETATWHIEPVASANRVPGDAFIPWLPQLGIGSRWSALALAGAPKPQAGSLWRIAFAKPILGDFTCIAETEAPLGDGQRDLPVPHFLGVPISEESAKLDPTLSQTFRATVPRHAPKMRAHVELSPKETPVIPVSTPGGRWVYRELKLHNRVEADVVRSSLRGIVAEPGGARLRFALAGCELESVTVDGKHSSITAEELERVGLPIARPGSEFEVRFTWRTRSNSFGIQRGTATPSFNLPGEPEIVSTWSMGPEYRGWPSLNHEPSDAAEPACVKESTVRAFGFIAAALLALPAILGFAYSRSRFALIAALAFAIPLILASWLAPPGWATALRPALAVALGSLALAVRFKPVVQAKPTALAIAALLLAEAGQAQAPETVKVYILAGSKEEPNRFHVLVPKTALDKLDALSRPQLPDIAILSADYDALASGESVTVQAKYRVYSRKAEEQSLVLPLAGIRLEKATCDGLETYPEALPDRFLLPIRGSGEHTLIVRFTLPVQSAGIDRDAKFTVPDLPIAHVSFAAGLRGRQLDVPSRNGGQTLRVSTDGLRIEAEQGGGRTIQLHWRESGTAEGAKPAIAVKEGAIWDLSEADASLTAAWQYRVDGGTVGSLKIEWPEHVLPTQVSLEATEGSSAGLGIRSWKVGPPANGTVPIDIRLQTPAEGQFTLIVRGNSTKLVTARPVLLFPRCADAAEADRDSFYAVRFTGLKSEGVAVNGAIDFPADAVGRDFAKVPEFNFAKSPPARVVRRAGSKVTELRPALAPNTTYTPMAGEVGYTLGRRIEVEGAMRANAKESGSVEFDVPAGLILHDVWATGLAGWTRTGSRVQVWLNVPSADVIVRWSGQMPNPLAPDCAVDLPLPRWPSAVAKLAEPLAVRVRAASGWIVAPIPVVGLKSQPSSMAEEWLLNAEPEQHPTAAKFSVKLSPKVEAPIERPKPTPTEVVPAQAPALVPIEDTTEVRETKPGVLRPLSWLLGAGGIAALILLGGRRTRPETFLFLGLGSAAILGFDALYSTPFWFVAAYGAAMRTARTLRRIWRAAV